VFVLRLLNVFFFVFHGLLVLFALLGWMAAATRKWHLAVMVLITLSWFGLGVLYGWGYCCLTDWHWQVRRKLGIYDSARSYVQLMFQTLTGLEQPAATVDMITACGYLFALAAAVVASVRARRGHGASVTRLCT